MLDQGAPATMPDHQCKELEETVPRGDESGAALRGRIHIAQSRAAEQLMARAHAAAREAASQARQPGGKGEFAQAAALLRQAKAAQGKVKGAQSYRPAQSYHPSVAGYIPKLRPPTSQGSAAQLRLLRYFDCTEVGPNPNPKPSPNPEA